MRLELRHGGNPVISDDRRDGRVAAALLRVRAGARLRSAAVQGQINLTRSRIRCALTYVPYRVHVMTFPEEKNNSGS